MAAPNGLPRLERRVDERSPRRFLEVTARRIACLGNELGLFECWIWPLKIARALEVCFTTDQTRRGRDLARHVAFQPDRTEITYVGPDFTVRQTMFAPLDRRALVMTFDVECERALELIIEFTPEFKPMWPAGMGGQIALRDDVSGAFALTEELGRFAALFGSPEAEPVDVRADHALPRGTVAIHVPVSAARAKKGAIPFFVVGAEVTPRPLSASAKVGEEGAATGHARSHEVVQAARDEYRWIIAHWRTTQVELEEHWRDFLRRTTHFESDDTRHADAFTWAKIAIEKAWVEVDGLGRGLVAGLGPSGAELGPLGAGERPGFAWFFDGDAIVASRAMVGYGDRKGARRVLDFAAGHQRADGKMMHELVLSSRLCNWIDDYPYAYYKAQLTPGFIACLDHHLKLSADGELRQQLWPAVLNAYRCCTEHLEADGTLSNRTLGIAAVEAGSLVGRIRSEIYLQGIWISALRGVSNMARALGHHELAREAESRCATVKTAFETYWSEPAQRYGFARLVDGSLNDDSTSFHALPLSRGIGESSRALRNVAALNRPNLASDWGVRLFADDASVYDTSSYNTGSVFPYTNNFAILALFAHGFGAGAHQLLASQVALHGFSGLGFVPEHLRADRCEVPPRGVPHQIFSSACIVQSTLFGAFGMSASADDAVVFFAPQLPPRVHRTALRSVRVADATFDLELTRTRGECLTRLTCALRHEHGTPLKLFLRPWVPPLTRGARCDGSEVSLERIGAGLRMRTLGLEFGADIALRFEYESGPELLLDDSPLIEGSTSSRLRVCEVNFDDTSVTWTVWGLAGTTYRVGVHSDRRVRFEECLRVGDDELEITFPPSTGPKFVSKDIRAVALD